MHRADLLVSPTLAATGAVVEELLVSTLESGGVLTFQISGESMTPMLRPGDRVEVIPCRVEELLPGDVVLLSGLVVHRFLYRTSKGLVMRGDGALSADPFWPPRSVLGKVRSRLRGSRVTHLTRGWPRVHGRLLAAYWRWRGRFRRAFPRRPETASVTTMPGNRVI